MRETGWRTMGLYVDGQRASWCAYFRVAAEALPRKIIELMGY